jgi:hypothetical protein
MPPEHVIGWDVLVEAEIIGQPRRRPDGND